MLDSTFKFSGLIRINASQHGYITQLNHQSGDYVQDGEQLAVISDRNSFSVFLLELPYELRPEVLSQHTVELLLPDGEKLSGTIGSVMPTVDSASQTQQVIIRESPHAIPENPILLRCGSAGRTGHSAQSLPRAAVLTDETETDFWS